MAFKAILLFLFGYFVVEIHSNCPHPAFVSKHVCADCNTVVRARQFAEHIETNTMRSELTTIQTIYTTQNTKSRDWTDNQVNCELKSPVDKYQCRKIWFCRRAPHDSKALHRKTDRCPDLSSVNLCSNCKNTDADAQAKAVGLHAVKFEKDKYVERRRSGKQYQRISAQTIYVVNDLTETRTTFRTSPRGNNQFCEMTADRPEYQCTSSWDCNKRATGKGKHRRSDGHLLEN